MCTGLEKADKLRRRQLREDHEGICNPLRNENSLSNYSISMMIIYDNDVLSTNFNLRACEMASLKIKFEIVIPFVHPTLCKF